LIPRPETAELVELIVKENPGARHLLDIGTGSGCIAISLDQNLPDAEVEAWDVSEEALAIASENNKELDARVMFRRRDVLSDELGATSCYDVIVSNPPYITEAEKQDMEANVLDWEPGLALFVPDDDPLRFYRRIARLGCDLLLPGGKLYFEINQAYGRETAHILEMNQYRDVRVIKDIFGKDRIVTANR
ncbi:HemK family protein methyltransferase, partial [Collinsella sp. BIOML-A1]|nr:HemK family protein methyltransferase [Collinsella sp. BIOML-A1]